MNTILIDRNIYLKPGTGDIHIRRTGDYDIFNDVITDRPSQFTIFVNANSLFLLFKLSNPKCVYGASK